MEKLENIIMEKFENMQRFPITKDIEIDWHKTYSVKALNLNTLIFEKRSDFCADDKPMIALSKDFVYVDWDKINENQVSKHIEKLKYDGFNVLYALYSINNNFLVGFVYEEK